MKDIGRGDDEIPLREWIRKAVSSVDEFAIAFASAFDDPQPASGPDPVASAVTSDGFLSPALKVARSLAEQIDQDQQSESARRRLPMPGPGWAEHATVRLKLVGETSNGDRGEWETLTFSPGNEATALPVPAEPREKLSSPRKEALAENGDGIRNGAGNACREQPDYLSSGTGKSVLAHRFGSFVTSQKGMFLSAKFDQLQQTTPFSAIAAAFNQYCDMLLSERESTHAKMVTAQLKLTLGYEAHHLVKVIPGLKKNLGLDDITHELKQGCVNAQKRLLYLLCRFVEVIAAFPEAPVTLFLDDLQWADLRSIEVIRQLLLTLGTFNNTSHFFLPRVHA
ncbi:hypothetical protein ACHAWF_010955 [Thalassiosira exigua]